MFTVFIEGLEFYGYHGVPAEERVLGHRYVIDLYLTVNDDADSTDRIGDTADYALVGQEVMASVAKAQAHTLEHLAAETCKLVLDRFSSVQEVRLRLSKPYPPAPMIAARAGVEMVRKRG